MNELPHLLFYRPDVAPRPVDPNMPRRSPAYGTVAPSILEYIKAHPDCTPNMIREELELNRFSVDRALRTLRDKGLAYAATPANITGKARAPAKWRAK